MISFSSSLSLNASCNFLSASSKSSYINLYFSAQIPCSFRYLLFKSVYCVSTVSFNEINFSSSAVNRLCESLPSNLNLSFKFLRSWICPWSLLISSESLPLTLFKSSISLSFASILHFNDLVSSSKVFISCLYRSKFSSFLGFLAYSSESSNAFMKASWIEELSAFFSLVSFNSISRNSSFWPRTALSLS